MRILAIESSSLVASAAIADFGEDEILRAEYTTNLKKTHSQTLLPMIDEIMRTLDAEGDGIDAIAVAAGPGSFTGLRIGAATVKGLGLVWQKPVIPVPTVDAMAYQFYGTEHLICPIMDARRSQVYTGIYTFKNGTEFETRMPQCAMALADLCEELNRLGERVVFAGDGIPVARNILRDKLTVPYTFAPAHMNRQRAASVASLGAVLFREGKTVDADVFAPDYLRVSQAERERKERAEHGEEHCPAVTVE
ncbi:MAG: tRNA (adenosine(37)-N6)-threonylcarbamoyltransferase complex dimerization subunit type 1 TsaB [Lachnospiraceae bacterium]|nr:tRNA (adenosine(37)-N6)-threonylcarbamoyltransferase complex dimerization subunit type 1 TsaB [Lachnospiraceae bacterium]